MYINTYYFLINQQYFTLTIKIIDFDLNKTDIFGFLHKIWKYNFLVFQ